MQSTLNYSTSKASIPNNRHSNNTPSWGTPKDIIEASRTVLDGVIDLDPASSKFFNSRVGARWFLTEENDGLVISWCKYLRYSLPVEFKSLSVFLNPPSGRLDKRLKIGSLSRIKTKSLPKLFWQKLLDEIQLNHVSHAIYVAYSQEQLQTTQLECTQAILDFPVCIPVKRLHYTDENGNVMKQGTHSSAIAYVPGLIDNTKLFKEVFSQFGKVINC